MKLNIFNKYLCGALAIGLMASCSSDLPGDEGKILENESTTYVRVSLMGEGNGSRADEVYENGSGDESAVSSILLTFFDAGRNYVGSTTINVGDDPDEVVVPGADNSVERILTVVAPVTLPENINYPKYVIAYVNPTSKSSDLALDKVEDAMRIIRERSTVSPYGFRTMNNSVFYRESTGFVRFATEVDFKSQFYNTSEEAKAAGANAINITVERVEAKVRLDPNQSLSEINVTPVTSPDGNDSEVKYSIEFVPEAWFVNATEKRTFLLKNYRSTRVNYLSGNATYPSDDFGMLFPALQDAFKTNNASGSRWNEINNEDYLRSFWAIDPTYFIDGTTTADIYPDVSFDVRYTWDGVTINPGVEGTMPSQYYPLEYRSYTNVMKEWNTGTSTNYVRYNDKVKMHEYVLENTQSLLTLGSTDAKASMTAVVILGHYMIKNTTTDKYVFDGTNLDKKKSFYIRHDAGSNTSVMLSDEEAINFFLERGGSTLFVQSVDKSGKPIENSYEPLRAAHIKDGKYGVSYDDFSLDYPNSNVTNGVKLSEQWRTLRVKPSAKIFVYDATINDNAGGYAPVTQKVIEERASSFYSSFGVVEKFQSGKAYFNVPLRHIWGVNKGAFEAKDVVLGDYGVVRNHIYELNIGKITGLGTGIGEVDQPIVPPTDNDKYYISTRLNILKWRLVKQNIDL